MQRQNILRAFLFVVFFSIGTAALAVSILCDDLLGYYRNKQLLRLAEETLNQLKSLNVDYDVLLEQLDEDPNLLERIAPATLGMEPADANTVYPNVTAEELDTARKVLAADSGREPSRVDVPDWLVRCSKPPQRIILFLAGAFLILISFICFGVIKQASRH